MLRLIIGISFVFGIIALFWFVPSIYLIGLFMIVIVIVLGIILYAFEQSQRI